ncbi:IclR family transcriptional regulator [Chelatococcus sp. SYSU_G07232]|uniref:IclR family transcriptional regulator n=1 Tax=Chelatococcus albus TaxID=3047466 RepID=A0ABT7AH38_9HYPH|nr:IclR family transcriptional regulator [Chelatococcus sp. SYSU_G07232]MDJ1158685.1 IclR family transcriptional regulator [Chelatococcus sp. SYSU_G07232]
MSDREAQQGTGLHRAFAIIRVLAASDGTGMRVTQIARESGLTQATAHRLLQALMAEGVVVQGEGSRLYRLSVEFFALAASAGNPGNLRDLCRPALLRLSASLGDTIFLLVRSGFDAVCLDRSEGPFPIRSFTGDVGGRVALGVGQGSLAILAFLPEAEREEVIRFNLPRLRDFGVFDEVYLRTEIARVRELGYAGRNTGLLPGMAGVAVPVLDRDGRAVAALSVGTIAERLSPERLPTVVELLRRETVAIGPGINPFDVVLRRPAQGLGGINGPTRIETSDSRTGQQGRLPPGAAPRS